MNDAEWGCFESGKIGDNLYLVDTNQYGARRVTSAFCYWDGERALLMDCGTSDCIPSVLRFFKKQKIPLDKIMGITGTHYHFDHMGGATLIAKRLVKRNPNFKIIIPQDMHDLLQDAGSHLAAAKTTFGNFVGSMNPAPSEEIYQIIEKDVPLNIELEDGFEIRLISTPGHCPSHCAIELRRDDKSYFIHNGEACGTLFHANKLLSMPTSMPASYNHQEYMKNIQIFRDLKPEIFGFCHFGAIKGQSYINEFINEHENFNKDFHQSIIAAFNEGPSTKFVMEKTHDLWEGRFDERLGDGDFAEGFLDNLRLALTYGQMIDLGFRKTKYEKRIEMHDTNNI